MKRVWTLYRVSDITQVDANNDIMLQKNANRAFIAQHTDWELTREVYERGISGWKNYSENRDELLEIKRGAENQEFDVLVVFMLDRLGRKDDETPFIVEFFVKHNIEVWSVMEGQRKIENHIDKLMNYISFWQSSGESLKTSIRVKEKLSQLNHEGQYAGGKPPLGYELYETKVKNKKDKLMKDIKINEEEANIVRLIFDLCVNKSLGTNRIANELNRLGYRNRKNNLWTGGVICRIIRNAVYIGYKQFDVLKPGELKLQPKREELVILSEELWNKAQQLLDSRKSSSDNKIVTPSSSKILLTGIIRCGYCGRKLQANYTTTRKSNKNGTICSNTRHRYVCGYGNNCSREGHDATYFSGKKYEREIIRLIKEFMKQIQKESFVTQIEKYSQTMVKTKLEKLTKLKKQNGENEKRLELLIEEIEKCILGESKFTEDNLSHLISKKENEIKTNTVEISILEQEINTNKIELEDANKIMEELDNWEEKFDNADINTKKTMLSRIIDSIYIKKEDIEINLNLTVKQALDIEVQNQLYIRQDRVKTIPLIEKKIEVKLTSNF